MLPLKKYGRGTLLHTRQYQHKCKESSFSTLPLSVCSVCCGKLTAPSPNIHLPQEVKVKTDEVSLVVLFTNITPVSQENPQSNRSFHKQNIHIR